jgi:hypothetical protein
LLLSFASPEKEEHKAKRLAAEKQIIEKFPNFGKKFMARKKEEKKLKKHLESKNLFFIS